MSDSVGSKLDSFIAENYWIWCSLLVFLSFVFLYYFSTGFLRFFKLLNKVWRFFLFCYNCCGRCCRIVVREPEEPSQVCLYNIDNV